MILLYVASCVYQVAGQCWQLFEWLLRPTVALPSTLSSNATISAVTGRGSSRILTSCRRRWVICLSYLSHSSRCRVSLHFVSTPLPLVLTALGRFIHVVFTSSVSSISSWSACQPCAAAMASQRRLAIRWCRPPLLCLPSLVRPAVRLSSPVTARHTPFRSHTARERGAVDTSVSRLDCSGGGRWAAAAARSPHSQCQ